MGNLYGVDVLHTHNLTKAWVMEINNNPGLHAFNTLDQKEPLDAPTRTAGKKRMYYDVYSDTLRIMGFKSHPKASFTPSTLDEEFNNRHGFQLVYPPMDPNKYKFYNKHLSHKDKHLYGA